ncbi:hypothetical protein [Sulfurivermis fontis]|uniref:hypothetical protein n=1 Tax=Sulfurivermis fontis TaxID=1972068 RepID=UPI000FDB3898|nr:hypothetical protein [Sulfurivermis fontis]
MDIIITALYWSATALVVLALLTGIGLLVAPGPLRDLARPLDRWHSLRPALGPLDKPHYTERRIYHHHRLVGALFVFGAGYTLLRLPGVDPQAALGLMPENWDGNLRGLLAANVYWLLLVANFAALILGLVVYFRPSLLKRLEARSNRWLSTRQAMKPLDVYHSEWNTLLWRRPRLTGLFITAGSLYIWIILLAYRHGVL